MLMMFVLSGTFGIEWSRLDTLHIISGVPSTQTIYQATGLDMVPTTSDRSTSSRPPSVATPARTHKFIPGGETGASEDERSLPENDALKELEEEGMRLAAINMNGVVLSVGCFVSLDRCCLGTPSTMRRMLISPQTPSPLHLVIVSPSAPPVIINLPLPAHSPSLFRSRPRSSSDEDVVLGHQDSWFSRFQDVCGGMRARWGQGEWGQVLRWVSRLCSVSSLSFQECTLCKSIVGVPILTVLYSIPLLLLVVGTVCFPCS
jgi:hypothetical protein